MAQRQLMHSPAERSMSNDSDAGSGRCETDFGAVVFRFDDSPVQAAPESETSLNARTIEIAETDEEVLSTFDAMRHLHPEIPKQEYLSRVRLLESEQRYAIAALRIDGRAVSVAGFRLCRSLGWGKILYVDDLVTDAEDRSTGYGAALFAWLVQRAEDENCTELRLDSAVFRTRAHRFYFLRHMDIACFHFRIAIQPR